MKRASRPVEKDQYLRGSEGFADRHPHRTGGDTKCKKLGTNVFKTPQTDRHTDVCMYFIEIS